MTLYEFQSFDFFEGELTASRRHDLDQKALDGDSIVRRISNFILERVQIGMRIEKIRLNEYQGGGYYVSLDFWTSKTQHSHECIDMPAGWLLQTGECSLRFGDTGHKGEYVLVVPPYDTYAFIPDELFGEITQLLKPDWLTMHRGSRIEICNRKFGTRDDAAVLKAVNKVFGQCQTL